MYIQQSSREQSRAEQSRAEQSRAEQSRAEQSIMNINIHLLISHLLKLSITPKRRLSIANAWQSPGVLWRFDQPPAHICRVNVIRRDSCSGYDRGEGVVCDEVRILFRTGSSIEHLPDSMHAARARAIVRY